MAVFLTFDAPRTSDAELQGGLRAASAVFDASGYNAAECWHAVYVRDRWDTLHHFDEAHEPSAEEWKMVDVWTKAEAAAFKVVRPDWDGVIIPSDVNLGVVVDEDKA